MYYSNVQTVETNIQDQTEQAILLKVINKALDNGWPVFGRRDKYGKDFQWELSKKTSELTSFYKRPTVGWSLLIKDCTVTIKNADGTNSIMRLNGSEFHLKDFLFDKDFANCAGYTLTELGSWLDEDKEIVEFFKD